MVRIGQQEVERTKLIGQKLHSVHHLAITVLMLVSGMEIQGLAGQIAPQIGGTMRDLTLLHLHKEGGLSGLGCTT